MSKYVYMFNYLDEQDLDDSSGYNLTYLGEFDVNGRVVDVVEGDKSDIISFVEDLLGTNSFAPEYLVTRAEFNKLVDVPERDIILEELRSKDNQGMYTYSIDPDTEDGIIVTYFNQGMEINMYLSCDDPSSSIVRLGNVADLFDVDMNPADLKYRVNMLNKIASDMNNIYTSLQDMIFRTDDIDSESVTGSTDLEYDEDIDNYSDYTEVASKSILDQDGFYTDYTMYQNNDTGEYIFIFGDKDSYGPENSEPDWEAETEDLAWEWFNSYNGFEE